MRLGPLCPAGALIFFQYLDEIYIFHIAKVLIINVYALFHKHTHVNVLLNKWKYTLSYRSELLLLLMINVAGEKYAMD